MLALHSRTEISLILQSSPKSSLTLSLAATRTFRPNGVARYIRLEQQRIESPGTELVPVPGELLDEP
jgi:hypothetical protein